MVTNNNSNTYIVPTTNHEVTQPLQPAFSATLNSDDNNISGQGNVYQIGTNVAWTEIKDQNADFNTNGTFTSPVTGLYFFTASCLLGGLINANKVEIIFSTSNRTYYNNTRNAGALMNGSNQVAVNQSYFTDMDSGDTAKFNIVVGGESAVIIDVLAGTNATIFQGFLIC